LKKLNKEKTKMTTQIQLTEALAQKEAVGTSLSQSQQRLEEISKLLTDPSSNVPELTVERRLLIDSREVFETQLEAIAKQIKSLEAKLVNESKDARKAELEAFLAGWEGELGPRLKKIQTLSDQLLKEMRLLHSESQPYSSASFEVGQRDFVLFGIQTLPVVAAPGAFGTKFALGSQQVDLIDPAIKAAALQAQIAQDAAIADRNKQAQIQRDKAAREKELTYHKGVIARCTSALQYRGLNDKERRQFSSDLASSKRSLARLEKELAIAT
jgi:hypothetical protein